MPSAQTLKHRLLLVGLGLTAIAGWSNYQAAPSYASTLVLEQWNVIGDVSVQGNSVALSNNGLLGDDGSLALDTEVNFSGQPAVSIDLLESALGLADGALDLPNFAAAEGSAIYTDIRVTRPTTFSFDWTFLTNESFFTPTLPDYAFITIDQSVISLANAFEPLVASPSGYQFQRTGTFSQAFEVGTYQLAIGVVDVGDIVVSSGFSILNAEFTPPLIVEDDDGDDDGNGNGDNGGDIDDSIVSVDEPGTLLGQSLIGLIGITGYLMGKLGRNRKANRTL